MLNVHHDEVTSVNAGKANIAQYGGRLIELTHSGQRLILFRLAGHIHAFDPNRIFSDAGIKATLEKHSSYSAEAHTAIKAFATAYLQQFGLDHERVIIALHNTLDGVFSVEHFTPGGKFVSEAADTYVSPRRSKYDFNFVTDRRFFDFLKEHDFNVVLQDNENMSDDGSLSVYFARKGIPYINIEAEMNRLESQIEMLASIREMLSKFKLEG